MAFIIGYVLRTSKAEELKKFFECLGVVCTEEQHADGPVHQVMPMHAPAVLELYPRSKRRVDDMLIISVDSVKKALFDLRTKGFLQGIVPEQNQNGTSALVFSPDGREVLLQEKEL